MYIYHIASCILNAESTWRDLDVRFRIAFLFRHDSVSEIVERSIFVRNVRISLFETVHHIHFTQRVRIQFLLPTLVPALNTGFYSRSTRQSSN